MQSLNTSDARAAARAAARAHLEAELGPHDPEVMAREAYLMKHVYKQYRTPTITMATLDIPGVEFLERNCWSDGTKLNEVVVAAAIFRADNPAAPDAHVGPGADGGLDPRDAGGAGAKWILLFRRGAGEAAEPNAFELPGGKVDEKDAAIKDTLVRGVKAKTGLDVAAIVAPLEPLFDSIENTTFKLHRGREVIETKVLARKSCLLISFVVEVVAASLRIDAAGHEGVTWARKEEVEELQVTEGMKRLLLSAFEAVASGDGAS